MPGASTEDMRFGAVFSLKAYPAATDAPVFDPSISSSTASSPTLHADRADRRAGAHPAHVRQMGAADDAAASLRGQLIDAADDLASGRIAFGLHHASIAVFARSEAQLDEAAAQVRAAGQRAGCVLVREDIGARATWFAQHPGNSRLPRPGGDDLLAQLRAFHGAACRAPRSRRRRDALGRGGDDPAHRQRQRLPLQLPSPRQGRGAQPSATRWCSGQTGSGKTLGTAFLIAQARRTGARVIVFDKDRGLEMPLRAMGGAYGAVRLGEATGFNPFAAETDERGRAWLADWLAALLSRDGTADRDPVPGAGPGGRRERRDRSRACAGSPPSAGSSARSTTTARSYDRMGEWDADGGFGWLFSGDRPSTICLLRRR